MRVITRKLSGRSIPAAFIALVAFVLLQPSEARAQWTTGTDINNTNAGNVGIGTSGATARGSYTDLLIGPGPGTPNNPQIEFYGPTRSATIQYDEPLGGLVFYTNAPSWTQALFLANTGKVGIGTATPSTRFVVSAAPGAEVRVDKGPLDLSPAVTALSSPGSTTMGTAIGISAGPVGNALIVSDNANFYLVKDTKANFVNNTLGNGTALMTVTPAGRIGIGTSSPATVFHLQTTGATKAQFLLQNSTAATQIETSLAGNSAQWNYGLDQADSNKFKFSADGGGNLGTGTLLTITTGGGVGIGTAGPSAKLDVNAGSNAAAAINATGTINATGAITGATISATYQDVAEWVPSTQKLSAGTVVVLDGGKTNHVLASTRAYDTKVAGVVSAEPGVILGVGGEGKLKVATTGRVRVKVDATRGAIEVGDLLVTSEVEGVAMKSVEVDLGGVKIHRPGTIIGKALEPLASGTGEILVLLSLQ